MCSLELNSLMRLLAFMSASAEGGEIGKDPSDEPLIEALQSSVGRDSGFRKVGQASLLWAVQLPVLILTRIRDDTRPIVGVNTP
jgi:hypothetical protein